jgi:hypothetical protein
MRWERFVISSRVWIELPAYGRPSPSPRRSHINRHVAWLYFSVDLAQGSAVRDAGEILIECGPNQPTLGRLLPAARLQSASYRSDEVNAFPDRGCSGAGRPK